MWYYRFDLSKRKIKSKSDSNLDPRRSITNSNPKVSKSHSDIQELKTRYSAYQIKNRRNNYFNMFSKPKSA